MKCLALLDSGNYAMRLSSLLERKGYVFEVVATPCQIAKGGCGYCLKFDEQYCDLVLNEAMQNNINIREIYRVTPLFTKNKYEKIY